MCGNHSKTAASSWVNGGSPPRVREPQLKLNRKTDKDRIAPACAGTTKDDGYTMPIVWDHPRVCGNHSSMPYSTLSIRGSPPRVREPLQPLLRSVAAVRITPACAGTTQFADVPRSGVEDHPRVCGNHYDIEAIDNSDTRITPACAGTTYRDGLL